MNFSFWNERWRKNTIGFHQDRINSYLMRYYDALNAGPDERIFVPLCGKSLDMIWLHEKGHPVTGVEFSSIAVEAFFQENGLSPEIEKVGKLTRYRSGTLEIFCGDFFALTAQNLQGATIVYDRAALIALPPESRSRYAQAMHHLFPSGTRILLITIDYPQTEMNGPPFAVPEAEVEELFGSGFDIHTLESEDVLERNARFRERGLTELKETAHLLKKR